MTRARELDERLTLYAELSGIPNAMRSFAMAELRKVARRGGARPSRRGIVPGDRRDGTGAAGRCLCARRYFDSARFGPGLLRQLQ
jgi:hypothetical protein